mmetsp:Transcript_7498/g.16932  ORF Transcript_7498/g.16932 Transcript_7498/m.16932 type:complete len:88 (-) Transcript_7498:123-386(-)
MPSNKTTNTSSVKIMPCRCHARTHACASFLPSLQDHAYLPVFLLSCERPPTGSSQTSQRVAVIIRTTSKKSNAASDPIDNHTMDAQG